MAAPVDAARAGTNGSTASATATVNLPSGIRAGDLLVVCLTANSGGAQTWPSGWTKLKDAVSPHAANDSVTLAYRYADGSEGSTISVTITSAKYSGMAWRITGAEDPAVQVPELSADAIGNSVNPDATTTTPTGGSKEYLWLSIHSIEGEGTSVTYPSSYSNGAIGNSGGASTTATNSRTGGASRALTAASEDTGAYTYGTGGGGAWVTWTMAIHPKSSFKNPAINHQNPAVL